jgi:hypothetical protein
LETQPQNDINNETRLFNLVRNWYQLYPGTVFPLDSWAKKLDAYGLSEKDDLEGDFEVNVGRYKITFDNPGMIPVLASINLGADRQHIAKLLQHHACTVIDFDSMRHGEDFSRRHNDDSGKLKDLSRLRIEIEFFGAMLKVPEQRQVIESYINSAGTDISMPMMMSDHPPFWPNSRIDAFFSNFMSGQVTGDLPVEACPSEFLSGDLYLAALPDDEIRTLLHRGGFLNKWAINENGYRDRLFAKALEGAALGNGSDNAAVIRAINSVTDETERGLIAKKLIGALANITDYSGSAVDGADKAALYLPLLDQNTFKDVIDSKVLRINLLEYPVVGQFKTSPFHEMDETRLFRDLSDELMAIAPEDLRTHHFRSLSIFAKHWPKAHKATDVDINGLVVHMVKGLQCFLEAPCPVDKSKHDELASTRVGRFIKLAARLTPPDYERLNQMSSECKRIMCLNGYKIAEFSGMSYQDKGQVLDDALGL